MIANFSQTWLTRCTSGVALDVLDDRVDQQALLVDREQRGERLLDGGDRGLLTAGVAGVVAECLADPGLERCRVDAGGLGERQPVSVSRSTDPPASANPAAGWSMVPSAQPVPSMSWVDSPVLRADQLGAVVGDHDLADGVLQHPLHRHLPGAAATRPAASSGARRRPGPGPARTGGSAA